MEIKEFVWTEKVIHHIARHNVYPEEIEQVAFHNAPYIRKGRKGLRYLLGTTSAGEYLFVVYKLYQKGRAKVVTAREMDDHERKLYKRRGK